MVANYVHLIPNLEAGGAERQLCNLALAEHVQGLKPKVIVLTEKKSALWYELEQAGVEVLAFPLSGAVALVNFVKLLTTLIKLNANKYVLAAWMYHASFISMLVKVFNPKLRVFWMIRRTEIPSGLTGFVCRINALFSNKVPEVIISNSAAGLRSHIKAGYSADRFVHIPNIIDCEKFSPSYDKFALRNELHLAVGVKVFACVARYAPIKGHLELLKALLPLKGENFVCLLVGRGVDTAESLTEPLSALVSAGKVIVLGESSEVPKLIRALDFLIMPSLSEGFPNVVAEAMASRVPCIVTDVGDAADIVANTGVVVPAADIAALTKAITGWLKAPKEELAENGRQAEKVIREHYSLDKVVMKFRALADSSVR